MEQKLNRLISSTIEEIHKSVELSNDLFRVYAELKGIQPNFCSTCMGRYLDELKRNWHEMLKKYIISKSQKCKAKYNGLKWFAHLHKHLFCYQVTDEIAKKALELMELSESDFEILPEMEAKSIDIEPEVEVKRSRKPKNK